MQKREAAQIFEKIRQRTVEICQPLFIEDYVIQSMPDVSPPKWHLAHTTWFFETFLLKTYQTNYTLFHPTFCTRFNSYYQTINKPYLRANRGLLSRPTTEMIYTYRDYVNHHLLGLINELAEDQFRAIEHLIILGLQHEQQHQELLLMDIKYNFFQDPTFPRYQNALKFKNSNPLQSKMLEMKGGIVEIGHLGGSFCFDNESPRHKKLLFPYLIASQLVTNGEYLEFIEGRGYEDPQWWLADGWDWILQQKIKTPLYWIQLDKKWYLYTLNGLNLLNLAEPVSHISYYEANAYAKWRGMRLPTEEEWEHFVIKSKLSPQQGNFLEEGYYHPKPSNQPIEKAHQFFGDLWEWTASPYSPYPGYQALEGSLGEYNEKFMANQIVLRGGSCVTPREHIRATYRNFYQPEKRWQFSGIRLAANP